MIEQWKLPTAKERIAELMSVEPPRPPKPRKPGWIVGRDAEDGGDFVVPYEELFQTHVHVFGVSGWGKTFTLYSLVCQSILHGHGVVLVDPDSQLYQMVLNFLVQQEVEPERVVLINPLLDNWTVKLNPLESWDGDLGMGTSLAAAAMLSVAHEGDFEGMPRLRNFMEASCLALENAQQPLALLRWFLSMQPASRAMRSRLTKQINDPTLNLIWDEFAEYPKTRQIDLIESTINRVSPLSGNARIRRMLTYPHGNLDWKNVLDEGKIVLCNLGQQGDSRQGQQARQVVGSMIVNGVVQGADRRGLNPEKHSFVFCDEFSEYISDDVKRALDRARKRSVHFVLAHQRIAQIAVHNPDLWSAIINECKVKIYFGGMGREDAERMAGELFTGQMTGDEIKRTVSNVAQRPYIKWEELVGETEGEGVLHGGSKTKGGSTTRSKSKTDGTTAGGSSARTRSVAMMYSADGILFQNMTGYSVTESFQEASNYASQHAETTGIAKSKNWSEGENWGRNVNRSTSRTLQPVTYHEEFLQPAMIERYTLEESKEKRVAQLMNLDRRTAVVKLTGQDAVIVSTLSIREWAAPWEDLRAYEDVVCRLCPYVVETPAAEATYAAAIAQWDLDDTIVAEPDDYGVFVSDLLPAELPLAPQPRKQLKAK